MTIAKGRKPDGSYQDLSLDDAGLLKVNAAAGGGGGAVTIADGADAAIGTTTDAPALTDSSIASLMALFKRLLARLTTLLAGGLPAALGQGTKAQGLRVVLPSDQDAVPVSTVATVSAVTAITNVVHVDDNAGSLTVDNGGTFAVQAAQTGTWTVQPGNTANTTAWLVTGAGGTFPATQSGTWNVGTVTTVATVSAVTAITNALPAGEAHLGEVGGNSQLLSPSVTVSTSPAYTSGDCVGGKLTLTNALRVSGGTAVLHSLTITDAGNKKCPFTLLLFDSDPAAGTYTDNAAAVLSTDLTKVIARVPVAAGDYVTVDSKAVACLAGLGRVVKASGSATLYAVLVASSNNAAYAATTDLAVKFGLLRD